MDEIYKKATEDASTCVKAYQKLLEDRFSPSNAVPCEMVVGRGDTRDEIVDYVEACGADLLIMGSREMGALKRYQQSQWNFVSLPFFHHSHITLLRWLIRTFIGSTGDYCIHHCHCPVLIVKKPEPKKQ